MALKNWKKEDVRHFIPNNVAFWRNTINKGFVEVNPVQKGAPAWDEGKFQIVVNTPNVTQERYRNTKKDAIKLARYYMKEF
jgi:hypothetical protein